MDSAKSSLFPERPYTIAKWEGSYEKELKQLRQNYVSSTKCFADKTKLPVNEKERFESQFRETVWKWQLQGNQGVRGSLTRLLKEKFPDQSLTNLKINGLTIDQFEMGVYGERKHVTPTPSAPPLPRPPPKHRAKLPLKPKLTERQLLLQLLTRVEKMEKEKEREPGDDHK